MLRGLDTSKMITNAWFSMKNYDWKVTLYHTINIYMHQ